MGADIANAPQITRAFKYFSVDAVSSASSSDAYYLIRKAQEIIRYIDKDEKKMTRKNEKITGYELRTMTGNILLSEHATESGLWRAFKDALDNRNAGKDELRIAVCIECDGEDEDDDGKPVKVSERDHYGWKDFLWQTLYQSKVS